MVNHKQVILMFNEINIVGGGVYFGEELDKSILRFYGDIFKVSKSSDIASSLRETNQIISIKLVDEQIPSIKLINQFREEILKSDIIHIHNIMTISSLIPAFLAFMYNKRLILTQHNNLYMNSFKVSNPISSIIFNIRSIITTNLIPLIAKKIIFITEAQKKRYLSYCIFKNILNKKSIVIPNFIDKGKIINSRRNQNKINLLFVGRLAYWKGFQDLIKIPDELNDINYLFIGEDKKKELFNVLVEKIKYNKNIIYYPKVIHEKILSYYDQSNVFILPSYSEVFPMTILEAMARGLVILVSDIPGMREIIKEGRNGYLFPPGDIEKMKELILYLKNNPKEIERISKNNLKDIHKFTAEKQVPKYIKVYEELLKE